jgi:hypothetical protein
MGHCHCSRCRKACGSAFHTAVLVRARYFRWLSGRELVLSHLPPAPYNLVRDSCGVCGCYLGEVASDLDFVVVSAAILEGELAREPHGHEWVSEAVPWHRLCDGLPCFAEGFPPLEAWRDATRVKAATTRRPEFSELREPIRPTPGSCLCGEVRYEVDGPLTGVVNCHCIDCRRCQGADFATNGSVSNSDFRLIAGESLIREYESSSGHKRCFCGDCGSPLYASSMASDSVRIRLGSLDADPGVNPVAHIWLSQSLPWHPPPDGLPVFERTFGEPNEAGKPS